MRNLILVAAASLAVAALPASAQPPSGGATIVKTEPGKGVAARVLRVSATVEAIDPATRTVTLRGAKGNTLDLPVGPQVKNFDQIKVGDSVVVRYIEALTLELKKGGAGIRERSERVEAATAQPGERPAAGAARQVTVVADVIAVNRKTMVVTLKGPKRTVDLKLRDPKQIRLVKVGDQVEATYTEGVAVSVEPATPKPAGAKK